MTLSTGLDIARSGLSVSSERTAVVSRNVANADDPLASRKIANVVTAPGGGARVASVTRVADAALLEKFLTTTASANQYQVVSASLDRLDQTINDPELDVSPAARIGQLNDALQVYASAPHDTIRGQSAIIAAKEMVASLNSASNVVQQVRQQADQGIAASVENVNSLLVQFDELNTLIVNGTRSGADVTDALDARDRVMVGISEEIGIKSLRRTDNDMVLFTDNGVTLFEGRARPVSFQPTAFFAPGTIGQSVYIDGVPIGDGELAGSANSGRLKGLAAVRDTYAVTYQNQLDEIARGLVETFAESDQSASPSLPDRPGLFTYDGAPAMPTAATLQVGLASTIKVSASVDPTQGGEVSRLRDGAISDPANTAYLYNATGASGFSSRLDGLVEQLSLERSFDPGAQADTNANLLGFASSSASWLQQARSVSNTEAEYRTTLMDRSIEALSSANGVNLDDEMTKLLELERSYAASTKLISAINGMFNALLGAVR